MADTEQWVRFIRKRRGDGTPVVEFMRYKPGQIIEIEDDFAFKYVIIEVTKHQSSLDYLAGI